MNHHTRSTTAKDRFPRRQSGQVRPFMQQSRRRDSRRLHNVIARLATRAGRQTEVMINLRS
jgi:hypothetical protein